MRAPLLAFSAVAIAAGFTPAAQAQQCGTLVRAFALDMTPIEADNRYAVPVTINGQSQPFLVDTGGAFTQISESLVAEMNLKPKASRTRMFDAYGSATNTEVTVDLGIGPLSGKGQDVPVTRLGRRVGGIFAADLMQNYDIDIDFAGQKLNYFLTSHCDGKVIYWQTPIVATVPFHGWNRGDYHMNVPVKIDGHEVTAIIDTGATGSTLDADTARQLFGLTPDTEGAVPLGTMGDGSHKVFGWTFKTLEIGGIKIADPRMRIIPDLLGKKVTDTIAADSHIRRITDGSGFTMLIGMDVLRKLHLYIASRENRLYVTPASDMIPAAKAPAPELAPAGR